MKQTIILKKKKNNLICTEKIWCITFLKKLKAGLKRKADLAFLALAEVHSRAKGISEAQLSK